jgi:hypothetical protein
MLAAQKGRQKKAGAAGKGRRESVHHMKLMDLMDKLPGLPDPAEAVAVAGNHIDAALPRGPGFGLTFGAKSQMFKVDQESGFGQRATKKGVSFGGGFMRSKPENKSTKLGRDMLNSAVSSQQPGKVLDMFEQSLAFTAIQHTASSLPRDKQARKMHAALGIGPQRRLSGQDGKGPKSLELQLPCKSLRGRRSMASMKFGGVMRNMDAAMGKRASKKKAKPPTPDRVFRQAMERLANKERRSEVGGTIEPNQDTKERLQQLKLQRQIGQASGKHDPGLSKSNLSMFQMFMTDAAPQEQLYDATSDGTQDGWGSKAKGHSQERGQNRSLGCRGQSDPIIVAAASKDET